MKNNSGKNKIAKAFAKNRTEELSSDVWRHFVVPLFFDRLDLLEARKPRMIIGGRGCGKTMLLRYFAHETQFSPHRSDIPSETTRDVGLYWRIDTQFSNAMKGRGLSEEQWSSAFDHFLSIIVSLEILSALKTIELSKHPEAHHGMFSVITFQRSAMFGVDLGSSIKSATRELDSKMAHFEMWVSNVGKVQEPIFLPGIRFIEALIEDVALSCKLLSGTVFHVFLDEFENLLNYQQRIINTRIKHSKTPLIFSVAMKRRGEASRQTVGQESVSDIADFRHYDLEELLLGSDFELFAAEVLCLHLAEAHVEDLPTQPHKLRDITFLPQRIERREYRDGILKYVRQVLPGQNSRELAENVFHEPRLLRKLTRAIEKALRERGSKAKSSEYLSPDFPQESITNFALLHRSSPSPDVILEEFHLAQRGASTKFADWVHNNFVGCLLWIYDSDQKVCPFYAGFDVFSSLAKGNLRHFLELCHRSLSDEIDLGEDGLPHVDIDQQARAARQTSISLIREIRSFGRLGNRLHAFVLRLGSLFALAHRRNSQSEPEQNHFSIKGGSSSLAADDETLIAEAVKWSVLIEVEETKLKETADVHQANHEYVLNPIYAPYFNISYRKKRKLEISVDEFRVLSGGAYDDVKQLLARYAKKWAVELEDASPTLFSHLIIEAE